MLQLFQNQAMFLRVSAVLVIVTGMIITAVCAITHTPEPSIIQTAITMGVSYLFLDKGIALTNSPSTDVLKQAAAVLVSQANAAQAPAPAPTPSEDNSNL